jgi:3,4-dihydroxy 2-butanone 4-phosphate synthase/GTP cyclohydrolase II
MFRALKEVEGALADLAGGRMIVVLDDPDRENEGNLMLAAQFTTPEAINFMTRQAGGWVSLALTPERCDELELQTVRRESARHQAPFTETVEARQGVTTGISTADQALSIQVAIDPRRGRGDLVSPGHVQPLRAAPRGVLQRRGHTEAAVDLARLAGLRAAGVICEVLNDDGSMARPEDLERFCAQHDLRMVTVADIAAYRYLRQPTIERVVEIDLPTSFGVFNAIAYRSVEDESTHVAFVKGSVPADGETLVRIQSRCVAGDVFHSRNCNCGVLLDSALERIQDSGSGALLYVAQDDGVFRRHCTVDERADHEDDLVADAETYAICAQMLIDLGVSSLRLLSAEDGVRDEIARYGLDVKGNIELVGEAA